MEKFKEKIKKIAVFSVILGAFPIIALGNSPTLSFSANPQTVPAGTAVALSWYSQDTDYCVASGAWSGSWVPAGSTNVYPKENSNYYINCVGPDGAVSDVKSVFVIQNQASDNSNPIVYQNYQTVFQPISYGMPAVPQLTAACAANPTVAEVGKPVTFVASQNNGAEPFYYRWSGDVDGSNSMVTAFFNSPGTKEAKVTIFDNRNRAAEGYCSVVVNPPAAANIASAAPVQSNKPKVVAAKTAEGPCQVQTKPEDKPVVETAANSSNGKFFLASLFGNGNSSSNNGGSKTSSVLIYLVPAFAALSIIVLGFLIMRINRKA